MKTFRQYLNEVLIVNTKNTLSEEWELAIRNPIWWSIVGGLILMVIFV